MNAQEQIVSAFLRCGVTHAYKRAPHYHCNENVNYFFAHGKEADLLAISTDGRDRIHIEVGVSVTHLPDQGFKPHLADKFLNKEMHEQVERYFGGQPFRKAYVIFDTDYPDHKSPVIIDGHEIEIWSLVSIIRKLIADLDTVNYQDPILRTLQFVKYAFSLETMLRRKRPDTRVSGPAIQAVSLQKTVEYSATAILQRFDEDNYKTISDKHIPDELRDK